MTMSGRPLIAIPARFSASASALRYRAEVTARGSPRPCTTRAASR
jgi:hypothetical protein